MGVCDVRPERNFDRAVSSDLLLYVIELAALPVSSVRNRAYRKSPIVQSTSAN